MAQNEIEVILARQLASYLAAPTLVVNIWGDISYYNEAAEEIFGTRFHETGALTSSDVAQYMIIEDGQGERINPEEGPIHVAVFHRRPSHRRVVLHILKDHQRHTVDAQAFPLSGQGNRHVGAMCTFWQVDPK